MLERVFRRKSVKRVLEEMDHGTHRLHRALNAFDLTILGIGAIVGVGIFVLTGTAAARHAGPAVTLSFVISGTACAFAALCYAEFAALIPVAGSAYNYAYATLGEIIAWIIGWDLILEYIVASIAVAIGWSGYFVSILKALGITLPVWCSGSPGSVPGAIINLPAILIVLFLTTILVVGIKESAGLTSGMVFVKISTIIVFLLVGVFNVNPKNWFPFMPFGIKGVLRGAALVFFAYIGFDAVSTAAEETKNPQKNIPIGILASLAICTFLYLTVSAVLTGIVPYYKLNHPAPVAYGLSSIGFRWGSALVAAGAVAGITSVLLVMLMGQPRIFFSMSRDGLLWPWIYRVHPRFRTPYIAQIFTGLVVAGFSGFFDIGTIAELCNIGTLFAFTIVCGGVIILRYTHPEIKRPFRCPMVPWIPLLGICFCLGLMLSLPLITWIRFLAWLTIGLIIYFSYGARHSRLAESESYKPEASIKDSMEEPLVGASD